MCVRKFLTENSCILLASSYICFDSKLIDSVSKALAKYYLVSPCIRAHFPMVFHNKNHYVREIKITDKI